jgi:hypothetical protein
VYQRRYCCCPARAEEGGLLEPAGAYHLSSGGARCSQGWVQGGSSRVTKTLANGREASRRGKVHDRDRGAMASLGGDGRG